MKKRDLQMILIVLGVILLLVFLISLIFKALNVSTSDNKDGLVIDTEISSGKSNISKEDQEKIDKYTLYMENVYTQSLTVEQRKAIIDLIDNVINAINAKNYDLLYSKMNHEHAKLLFSTQEAFNEYIESMTYGVSDYTCIQYNAKYYGYECIFASKSQNTNLELQIKPINDYSDYEVSFRKDLIDVTERFGTFYINGLSGMLKYELECANTLEYVVDITNTTNKDITCNLSDSNAEADYRGTSIYYKLLSPTSDITIPKNKSKEITFVFDISSTQNKRPYYINVSSKIGEKVDSAKVIVDSSEDDIGI